MNSRTRASSATSIAIFATLSIAALASCDDDDGKSSSTQASQPAATTTIAVAADPTTTTAAAQPGAVIMYTGDFDSPYCKTVRDWVAGDLGNEGPSDDPEVNRAYFVDYLAFVDKATEQAPPEIAKDWAVFQPSVGKMADVLDKYNYDGARVEAEATEDEVALLNAPPPAEEAAQENFHRFEAEVCHSGELSPADITYTGDANSEFCGLAEDPPSASPPADLEEYFTSGAAAKLADQRVAAAPPEIKADVQIEEQWKVEKTPVLLAAHGWAFARVLTEGTEDELITLTYAAPEVRDANSRLGAYYAQVCQQ